MLQQFLLYLFVGIFSDVGTLLLTVVAGGQIPVYILNLIFDGLVVKLLALH